MKKILDSKFQDATKRAAAIEAVNILDEQFPDGMFRFEKKIR